MAQGYRHGAPENVRKAKRLFKELLPRAKARYRKMLADHDGESGMRMESSTAVGSASLPFYRIENIAALHVYEAELGGWHADVVLKRVPVGVPDTMGTPVALPCKTRVEAVEAGLNLLVSAIAASAQSPATPAPPEQRWFELYDLALPLPGNVMDMLGPVIARESEHTAESVRARIDEVCQEFFGGPPTEVDLEALWQEAQDGDPARLARLLAVLAIALGKGVFRHPEWAARAPGADGPLRKKPSRLEKLAEFHIPWAA